MKKSKFSDAQIAFALRQAEEGTSVSEACREAGIAEATFYNWRKKYGGLMPSEIKRIKQLDEENGKLKRIIADLSLDKAMLQADLKQQIKEITETRVRLRLSAPQFEGRQSCFIR